PDAALYLTSDVVEAVIATALARHGKLQGEFDVTVPLLGKGTVTPDLVVRSMSIASSPRCPECLAVDARIDGDAGWRVGPSSGRTPVDLSVSFDTELNTARQADGQFAFTARPRELRALDLKLGGMNAAIAPR